MTSISGVSAISGAYGAAYDRKDPLATVARALSLSTGELKRQLRDGKSLSDVASAQGVSHDDLIAAIKAGRPSNAPANPSGLSDDELAEKIADRKGSPGRRAGLERLSAALDTDAGQLTSLSAADLVKKLRSRGYDLDQLRSVLNSGDLLDVNA
ncbi:hypothetical protein [Dactylosporangium sp. CA-092794]|uniref:hypothetical protein n=1 Tax=Dactylosporangium sp. CA-092794 TaxID=3239929 RepID=UPI003D944173